MVRLIALQDQQPGIAKIKKGQIFEMSSGQWAKRLVVKGLAKYADSEEPKKKREYHRRDMKAER